MRKILQKDVKNTQNIYFFKVAIEEKNSSSVTVWKTDLYDTLKKRQPCDDEW